jgi:hypothetical protein
MLATQSHTMLLDHTWAPQTPTGVVLAEAGAVMAASRSPWCHIYMPPLSATPLTPFSHAVTLSYHVCLWCSHVSCRRASSSSWQPSASETSSAGTASSEGNGFLTAGRSFGACRACSRVATRGRCRFRQWKRTKRLVNQVSRSFLEVRAMCHSGTFTPLHPP